MNEWRQIKSYNTDGYSTYKQSCILDVKVSCTFNYVELNIWNMIVLIKC